MRFKITYGLGGGFNSEYEDIIEAADEDAAIIIAWEMACEEYDQYAGMHGLRSVEDIMEEDGVDEEDAEAVYAEERESWLDYSAELA